MSVKLTAVKALDTPAKKQTRTSLDTLLITPDVLRGWRNPPFQRPLKVNAKVTALAEQIKLDGGVMPGVITLGVIGKDVYLLDGQHRREAFLLSECEEGFIDVRKHYFDDMADMGEEFVNLNSQLVRMRPDDILRGLEGTIEGIAAIRRDCPFVGYDMIRRSERAPILSMTMVLRVWSGSASDIPKSGGASALELARLTTMEEAVAIADFFNRCYEAWKRDPEYVRLWGGLNLTVAAWMWRRLVITQYSPRSPKLTKDMFEKCLMSLSADGSYLSWLVGRQLTDRDRSPCYNRMKLIFARRLLEATGKQPSLPAPPWAHSSAGRK